MCYPSLGMGTIRTGQCRRTDAPAQHRCVADDALRCRQHAGRRYLRPSGAGRRRDGFGDLACLFAVAGSGRADRIILCLAWLTLPACGWRRLYNAARLSPPSAYPCRGSHRRVLWLHLDRRTPHVAIGLIFVLIVILILSGDISQLASATVLLLLLVFSVVNSALIILKLRPGEPRGAFELPLAVPALAAVVCVALFLACADDCRRAAAGSRRALSLAQTAARCKSGVASGVCAQGAACGAMTRRRSKRPALEAAAGIAEAGLTPTDRDPAFGRLLADPLRRTL